MMGAEAVEKSAQSYRNRLLELDEDDLHHLQPHLEPVTLSFRQSLYEANEQITSVYFPITGIPSLSTR
jgi:hypothetical protein